VHDWLTGMRGGEKVLEAILPHFPGAPIYTLFHFRGSVSSQIESHPIHSSILQRLPAAKRHYRRYLPLFPAAIERFDLSGYDLVVSTSHCVAKGAIASPGARHLCYCHTPMRYVWDQQQAYFPDQRGPIGHLRSWLLARLRRWDAATQGRVSEYAANSSFVAGRIRRYYGRQAEVIPPPVDTTFFTPGEGEPGVYCLMVSALAPYKRLELGIAACQRLGIELRIIGTGTEERRLRRLAGAEARFLGRVDGDALRAHYRGALCLLQPGVEDFGIASVEALASGCPVVALDEGGVRDIVTSGEHGILYDRGGDPEALAAAIDKCRELGFNKLNLRGRAETFSEPRFRARFGAWLETKGSAQSEPAHGAPEPDAIG
jgi:glycosyltransferase involved in cell wall biosynthesis